MAETDKKTQELIKEVARRKKEIAHAEKSAYLTNCSFSWLETPNQTCNLHVESDVGRLLKIAAFLTQTEAAYQEAAKALGTSPVPKFTWNGHSLSDWMRDIKTKIDKLQIVTARKKLEALESRLSAIISPELRAQMELESIESELK